MKVKFETRIIDVERKRSAMRICLALFITIMLILPQTYSSSANDDFHVEETQSKEETYGHHQSFLYAVAVQKRIDRETYGRLRRDHQHTIRRT